MEQQPGEMAACDGSGPNHSPRELLDLTQKQGGAGSMFGGCLEAKEKDEHIFWEGDSWHFFLRRFSKRLKGCGSKLNRAGKPQVLVHVSTYQGNPFEGIPVF